MKRNPFTVGTPLLLSLMLVSLVSLGARLYRDHGLTPQVQATAVHQEVVMAQEK